MKDENNKWLNKWISVKHRFGLPHSPYKNIWQYVFLAYDRANMLIPKTDFEKDCVGFGYYNTVVDDFTIIGLSDFSYPQISHYMPIEIPKHPNVDDSQHSIYT